MGAAGCGAIAQIKHLSHLRDDPERFEIHGLCDISQHVLEMVGVDYKVPASDLFTGIRYLFSSDVDAVLICSSGTSAPQAIVSAQAGKHLLVEKPACATTAEAEAMVSTCGSAGDLLMVVIRNDTSQALICAAEYLRYAGYQARSGESFSSV
jgi:predicted dehydrogenase